jgi:hypothetical protein
VTESIFLNTITNGLYTSEHYIVVAADSGGTSKSTYKENICYTVKPLLTDLYGENHVSDKPISRISVGKGNVAIDVKKLVEQKGKKAKLKQNM